ncbi:MAG TPA: hypothetical protein VH639_14980 [Bryobacteraceae bacterium]|jgi:hypothetical protein
MPASERLLRWSSRVYRLLLLAYPRDFRHEYGREMLQVCRSRSRDLDCGLAAMIAYATHILWDWLKTTLKERKDAMTRDSKLAVAVGLIPTIAFTLHDLVFQLPDSEGEASLGFFLTGGSMLLVWGLLGYLAVRSRSAVGVASIKTGAIAGILSVGVFWLTFIVLNNLFIDRMSYEPDRIRAFKESGYAGMRAFVNSGMATAPFIIFIAGLMCIAALAGIFGGMICSSRRPVTAKL